MCDTEPVEKLTETSSQMPHTVPLSLILRSTRFAESRLLGAAVGFMTYETWLCVEHQDYSPRQLFGTLRKLLLHFWCERVRNYDDVAVYKATSSFFKKYRDWTIVFLREKATRRLKNRNIQ